MFDANVINYLESKGIACSPDIRAKHGLSVYVTIPSKFLTDDSKLMGQTKAVLTAEQYNYMIDIT